MVLERIGLGRILSRLPSPIAQVYTLFIVLIAWVFFRMPDLTKAWHFVLAMLGVLPGDSDLYFPDLYLTNATLLALCVGVLGALNVHEMMARWLRIAPSGVTLRPGIRGAFETVGLGLLLILVAMQVASTTYSPFIYFRF
ncbi:MAG: hypothetical protein KDB75_12350, partial [Flavobacteriales bacterium]|nr:hypothetical protein [Flavobacteriales bacterium]